MLEGLVLDVYSGLPFWFESEDGQDSTSVTTWLIDKGEVAGIEINDTVVITVVRKLTDPGFRAERLLLVDEDAAPEVVRWLVDAFQGRLGGPLAQLAARTGDQIGYYQVPINYRIDDALMTVSAPPNLKVQATGRRIPRSHPAGSGAPWKRCWIGEDCEMLAKFPGHRLEFDLVRARAVRGSFRFAS